MRSGRPSRRLAGRHPAEASTLPASEAPSSRKWRYLRRPTPTRRAITPGAIARSYPQHARPLGSPTTLPPRGGAAAAPGRLVCSSWSSDSSRSLYAWRSGVCGRRSADRLAVGWIVLVVAGTTLGTVPFLAWRVVEDIRYTSSLDPWLVPRYGVSVYRVHPEIFDNAALGASRPATRTTWRRRRRSTAAAGGLSSNGRSDICCRGSRSPTRPQRDGF